MAGQNRSIRDLAGPHPTTIDALLGGLSGLSKEATGHHPSRGGSFTLPRARQTASPPEGIRMYPLVGQSFYVKSSIARCWTFVFPLISQRRPWRLSAATALRASVEGPTGFIATQASPQES